MEYYNGFVFYLDENNPKWKEYYNNLGKKVIWSLFSRTIFYKKTEGISR